MSGASTVLEGYSKTTLTEAINVYPHRRDRQLYYLSTFALVLFNVFWTTLAKAPSIMTLVVVFPVLYGTGESITTHVSHIYLSVTSASALFF